MTFLSLRTWQKAFALVAVSAGTLSLVDCAQTATCFDPLQIETLAIDVSANIDPMQPDATGTVVGSGSIIYKCDAQPETLVVRGAAIYTAEDLATKIADVDLQFEGGSVLTTAGTSCSGLGTYSKKVTLTSSGIKNSLLSAHCGPENSIWFAATVERQACTSGTKQSVGSQVAINCP